MTVKAIHFRLTGQTKRKSFSLRRDWGGFKTPLLGQHQFWCPPEIRGQGYTVGTTTIWSVLLVQGKEVNPKYKDE